jgi:IclR family pca regulon transcriptional regulator
VTKTESKSVVLSVEKAFRVLQAFTAEITELPLAEIARRANVDNATAFRMLNTLVLLGYVERVPDTRQFRLTLKCLDLGFNAIARMDLRRLARPVLQKLVSPGLAAASIGVLDRGEVVYIERLQFGLTRLAVDIRVGARIPAGTSAMGRAILSLFDEERQRNELELHPRRKVTPKTEVDLKRLLRILKKTKEHGIAMVDQEWVLGLSAIAAPIIGADGPIAALSLAAIASSTMSAQKLLEQFGPIVIESAGTLSRALQASGSIVGET